MKIINFRVLFFVAIFFGVGIVFAKEFLNLSILYFMVTVAGFVTLFFVCKKFGCIKRFVLLFCVFVFGVGYFFLAYTVQMGYGYNNVVLVCGRITSVTNSHTYSSVVLDNVTINSNNKPFCISLNISGGSVKAGDVLTFDARLKQVELFKDNKFKSYYYKNNISYVATPKSDIIVSDGYLKLNEKISNRISNIIQSSTNSNISQIIKGVVIGDKSSLDNSIFSAYSQSGVAHLLAISGLHISVIVAIISFVLEKLKVNQKISFVVMFLFLLAYCYVCNFAPSVTRASLMSLTFLLAMLFGRKYDKLNCLALSALIILLFKPLYVFDAGFLLSYGCVFCIFTLTKPVKCLLKKAKCPTKLASPLSLIIAVQFGILPVSCQFFNGFNILSLVANLICVPLFEFVFVITFVICLVCLILPFLSGIMYLSELLFFGITQIANFFSMEFLTINLPTVNSLFSVASYTSIFVCSKYVNLASKKKLLVCLPIIVIGLISIV